MKTVRSSTGQLEYSFRSKLQGLQNYFFREFWNFLWFLLYQNFVSENFDSLYMEKTCLVQEGHPPSRKKKRHWPQLAFAHTLIVSRWLCEPFTDTDRNWSGRSNRNVPFHLTKLFSPGPLICILLTSTITKLAVVFVWSVQLECTVPLGTWIFRKARKVFNMEKSWPARRLTLPLQKGDWTRWVSLPAEPTFCNSKGSPYFVKKCVKRCLFQGSSGRLVTLLLETIIFHIRGA